MLFPISPLKLLCELILPWVLNKISFQPHTIVDCIYLYLVPLSAGELIIRSYPDEIRCSLRCMTEAEVIRVISGQNLEQPAWGSPSFPFPSS